MKFVLFFVLAGLLSLAGCGTEFPDEPVADTQTALVLRESLEAGAGGAAVAVALPDPTGWATLRGTFKLTGTPPAPEPLAQAAAHADAKVCAPGGKVPVRETAIVGPGGGLSGVAVYLNTAIPADNPKWLNESYNAQRGTEVPFDQKNCMFTTQVCGLWTAQTLKILNSDPIGHNTKIDPKTGARPFNQTIGANNFTTYEAGGRRGAPAPVSCSIHSWMKAYLLPRDNPYFAITDEKGEFQIPNLPAGVDLEFRVWQPGLDFVDGTIQVNGKSEKISKGRLKLKLTQGETYTYDATIDASLFK